MKLDRRTKSYLTVAGTSLIYFAMGLYFAAGNTGVYLTSYLIYRSKSDMKLDDAIWFLSAAGFSALLLPMGGLLERRVGVRGVCMIGGLLQSCGIFATYYALDTNFLTVVIVYGGSFLVSLASCYTSPMVNVCKWHPKHKGLVTGIGAASMAVAPSLFTPLITSLVNPDNLPANALGLFDDPDVLDRTKNSTIIQGCITLVLFLIGVTLTFPAEAEEEDMLEEKLRRESSTIEPVWLTKYGNINETKENSTIAEKQLSIDLSARFDTCGGGGQQKLKAKSTEKDSALDLTDFSIEPKFAFKTSEFWLLSLKVLI